MLAMFLEIITDDLCDIMTNHILATGDELDRYAAI